MFPLSCLVIYSLLSSVATAETAGVAFSCGEVCQCYEDPNLGLIADCSGRNLRSLPSRLPEKTQYIDLSDNPLICDENTLRNARSSITIKSDCLESNFVMDNNHNSVEIRGKGDHLRTRRAVPACETGWNKYLSSCYKYFNENHRWQDAKDRCSGEFGADLAKITSQDVHNFVYSLGTHQPFDIWIGLRQNAGSSDFVWTDGSQIDNFSFWDTGQPPIAGHDLCTGMSSRETLTNGRWITGDCADAHKAYVCEKAVTGCSATQMGDNCQSVEEKPNITSFRRLENTSAHYDAKVTLECKASGIPRPQVTLLVNALKANKIDSGHSIMAPYITTVTFKLKMTSEVECQVSNRMGIDFLRTRIEMKDDKSTYLKAVLRLNDYKFNASLKNLLSEESKTLAYWLEDRMKDLFGDVIRGANVVDFRNGSVLADILLYTVKGTAELVRGILVNAVGNNNFGDASLHSFGEVKACPREFFNVTWGATMEEETATQVCPRGASGESTRRCLKNGVWGYPDYRHCSSKEFYQLREKINKLFNLSLPSSDQITNVISELSVLTEPKQYDAMMAGDIKISTQILREIVEYNKKFANGSATNQRNIEGFLQIVSNLLVLNNLEDFSQLQKSNRTATDLARIAEDFGLQVANGQSNSKESFYLVKENIAMEAKRVAKDIEGPVTFPNYSDGPLSTPVWTDDGKQSITLPKALFKMTRNPFTNGTKLASFLFRTLTSFLQQESSDDGNIGDHYRVVSRIISSSVQPPPGKLAEPVVIEFSGIKELLESMGTESSVKCVYWDYTLNSVGGGWSTKGCRRSRYVDESVTCECDHLTNFAVLLDTSGISSQHPGHSETLNYITLVGCSMSLFGIFITLMVHYLFWRNLKSPKTTIHVNFCFALLAANIFLLIGSSAREIKVLCTVISIFLHYFFLSAIFWMLAEGLQIYYAIVQVFSGEWRWKCFYILGWAGPLVIVVPCLCITRTEGYGEDKTCWLSFHSGLIWAFIGPSLTVLLVNAVIFVWVIRAMLTSHKMTSASHKEKIKRGIKSSIILFPLLGLTWVFGVLGFDQHTVVFLYLFAIFNSLQGFFVFIFHCVLDQQVRAAIGTWWDKRRRTVYRSSRVDTTLKTKQINSLVIDKLPCSRLKTV